MANPASLSSRNRRFRPSDSTRSVGRVGLMISFPLGSPVVQVDQYSHHGGSVLVEPTRSGSLDNLHT